MTAGRATARRDRVALQLEQLAKAGREESKEFKALRFELLLLDAAAGDLKAQQALMPMTAHPIHANPSVVTRANRCNARIGRLQESITREAGREHPNEQLLAEWREEARRLQLWLLQQSRGA